MDCSASLRAGLVAAIAFAGLSAAAQTPTAAQAPAASATTGQGPGAAAQPEPGAYRSAFEGYQAYSDEKMTDWKQANDTVGKIGGWRAYAKEAAGGEQGQGQGTQQPAKPTGGASGANPHGGHGKQ